MLYSKSINFSTEIQKVCQQEALVSVDREATILINDFLHTVCKRLIFDCQRRLEKKRVGAKLTVEEIETTVEKSFPGEIRKHALAEANKTLLHFQGGFLEYDPNVLASISKKKKSKLKLAGSQFSKYISELYETLCPGMTLMPKAKSIVCETLGSLSSKAVWELSYKVKKLSQGEQSVTPEDIKKAIENLIPTEMRKHAIAQATMKVAIESDQIFQPKEVRIAIGGVRNKSKTRPKSGEPRKARSRSLQSARVGKKTGKSSRAKRKTRGKTAKTAASKRKRSRDQMARKR